MVPGAEANRALQAAAIASEQLGMAEKCLEMTVAYVKERRQFARPVGSFQGLKHRLADLWVGLTQARAAARYAAGCHHGIGQDAPRRVQRHRIRRQGPGQPGEEPPHRPAEERNRRSRPRTVSSGTPLTAAIPRNP